MKILPEGTLQRSVCSLMKVATPTVLPSLHVVASPVSTKPRPWIPTTMGIEHSVEIVQMVRTWGQSAAMVSPVKAMTASRVG